MWDSLEKLVQSISEKMHGAFPAHSLEGGGFKFIFLALVLSVIGIVAISQLKSRARKILIVTITFLAGLFYVLEFFIPVHMTSDGKEVNAFTPFLKIVGDFNVILTAFALGLGVYSASMAHGKNILKRRQGSFYSVVFFVGMILMATLGILIETPGHGDIKINVALHDIVYKGGLQALDSTMFSMIAFYIVSAAYRAFRVRSAEATLLMGAAFVVMLGQVYAGQVLTNWIPADGFAANFRVDTWSDWLLTRVNAPAVRAIGFGLGVGLLATALRIWLSLERGAYFDREM